MSNERWAKAHYEHDLKPVNESTSTQPSPRGQGDALELLARFLQEPLHDLDMEHEISLSAARDAIAYALAARQPVRPSTVSDDMMDVVDRLGSEHADVDPRAWDHLLIYAPKDKIADRQQVGDEERAETYRKGWEAGNAAQAVDLGQFREGDAALIKTRFYCENCKGTNLVSDGPTKWDFDEQKWVLSGEVYDDTYCEDCECNVRTGSSAVMV